jgi:hypothetical protein
MWPLTQGTRFDLSSNFGRFWRSYLFNHFFREFILKKAIFEFLNQFSHLNHQIFTVIIACHDYLDPLFETLGIWIQSSGAAGHVSSATYFSKDFWKIRTKIKD